MVVDEGQLCTDVGAVGEADKTEVGVVGEGVLCELQEERGLRKEEVSQPVVGYLQAIQLVCVHVYVWGGGCVCVCVRVCECVKQEKARKVEEGEKRAGIDTTGAESQ